MEIVTGKVGLNWDNIIVEVDGKKILSSSASLSNKSYTIGEEVQGVIINSEFKICQEYIHEKKGKIFGFISKDEINEDWITITTLLKNENDKSKYKIGKKIGVSRKQITNY
jgi:hypothetical protein